MRRGEGGAGGGGGEERKKERERKREKERDISYTLINVNPFSCLCVPACLHHKHSYVTYDNIMTTFSVKQRERSPLVYNISRLFTKLMGFSLLAAGSEVYIRVPYSADTPVP